MYSKEIILFSLGSHGQQHVRGVKLTVLQEHPQSTFPTFELLLPPKFNLAYNKLSSVSVCSAASRHTVGCPLDWNPLPSTLSPHVLSN